MTLSNNGKRIDTLISQRADPYIVKGNNGYYYFTASIPYVR